MKKGKKLFSYILIALSAVFCIGSLNLSPKSRVSADGDVIYKTYETSALREGDFIEFGEYPQRKVAELSNEDINTLNQSANFDTEDRSGYYVAKTTQKLGSNIAGTDSNGNNIIAGHKYHLFTVNGSYGEKYPAEAIIDKPSSGGYTYRKMEDAAGVNGTLDPRKYVIDHFNSDDHYAQAYQSSNNGYITSKTYLFEVQPLTWKVVKANSDVYTLVCTSVIDAMDFNLYDSNGSMWAYSYVRNYLNNDSRGKYPILVRINNDSDGNLQKYRGNSKLDERTYLNWLDYGDSSVQIGSGAKPVWIGEDGWWIFTTNYYTANSTENSRNSKLIDASTLQGDRKGFIDKAFSKQEKDLLQTSSTESRGTSPSKNYEIDKITVNDKVKLVGVNNLKSSNFILNNGKYYSDYAAANGFVYNFNNSTSLTTYNNGRKTGNSSDHKYGYIWTLGSDGSSDAGKQFSTDWYEDYFCTVHNVRDVAQINLSNASITNINAYNNLDKEGTKESYLKKNAYSVNSMDQSYGIVPQIEIKLTKDNQYLIDKVNTATPNEEYSNDGSMAANRNFAVGVYDKDTNLNVSVSYNKVTQAVNTTANGSTYTYTITGYVSGSNIDMKEYFYRFSLATETPTAANVVYSYATIGEETSNGYPFTVKLTWDKEPNRNTELSCFMVSKDMKTMYKVENVKSGSLSNLYREVIFKEIELSDTLDENNKPIVLEKVIRTIPLYYGMSFDLPELGGVSGSVANYWFADKDKAVAYIENAAPNPEGAKSGTIDSGNGLYPNDATVTFYCAAGELKYSVKVDSASSSSGKTFNGHYYLMNLNNKQAIYPQQNSMEILNKDLSTSYSTYSFKVVIKYPYVKGYASTFLTETNGVLGFKLDENEKPLLYNNLKIYVGETVSDEGLLGTTKTTDGSKAYYEISGFGYTKFNDTSTNKELYFNVLINDISGAYGAKNFLVSFTETKDSEDSYSIEFDTAAYNDTNNDHIYFKNGESEKDYSKKIDGIGYGTSKSVDLAFDAGYYLKSGYKNAAGELQKERTSSSDVFGYYVPRMDFTYSGLVLDANGYRYADDPNAKYGSGTGVFAGQRVRIDKTGAGISFDEYGNRSYTYGNATATKTDYGYKLEDDNKFVGVYTLKFSYSGSANNELVFDLTKIGSGIEQITIGEGDNTVSVYRGFFTTDGAGADGVTKWTLVDTNTTNAKVFGIALENYDKVRLYISNDENNLAASNSVAAPISTFTDIYSTEGEGNSARSLKVNVKYAIKTPSGEYQKVIDNNGNPGGLTYLEHDISTLYGYKGKLYSIIPGTTSEGSVKADDVYLTVVSTGKTYRPWLEHVNNINANVAGADSNRFKSLALNATNVTTATTGVTSNNPKYWEGSKVWFVTNGSETQQVVQYTNGKPVNPKTGTVIDIDNDKFRSSYIMELDNNWTLFSIDAIDVTIVYDTTNNDIQINYTFDYVASDIKFGFVGVSTYDYAIQFVSKINETDVVGVVGYVNQGTGFQDSSKIGSLSNLGSKTALISEIGKNNIKTYLTGDVISSTSEIDANVTIFVPIIANNGGTSTPYYHVPKWTNIDKTYTTKIENTIYKVYKLTQSSTEKDNYIYILVLEGTDPGVSNFLGGANEIVGYKFNNSDYYNIYTDNTKTTKIKMGTGENAGKIVYTDSEGMSTVSDKTYLTADEIKNLYFEFKASNATIKFYAVYETCTVNVSVSGWQKEDDTTDPAVPEFYDLIAATSNDEKSKFDFSPAGYSIKNVKFATESNIDFGTLGLNTIALNNGNTKPYVTGLIGYFRKTAYDANDNIIQVEGSGYKVSSGLEMQYINGQAMYYKQTPEGIKKYYAVKVNSEGYVENIYTYKLVEADTKFMRTNVELYTLFGINHYEVVATVVGDTQSAAIEQASVPQDLMIGTLTGTNVEIIYKMNRSYTQSVPLISVKDGANSYLQIGNLNETKNGYTAVSVDENGKVDFGVDGDYVVEYIESANVYKVIIDAQKFTSNLTASLGSVNNGKIEGNGQEFVINKYNVSFTVPAESDTNMDNVGDFEYGEASGMDSVVHNGQAILTFKLGKAYDYKKLQFAIWASKDTTVNGSQLEPENVVNIVSLDSLQGGSGSTKISVNGEEITVTINYDATVGQYTFTITSVTHAVSVHLEKIDSSSNALKTFTYTVDYDHNIKGSDSNNLAYTVYKSVVETNGTGEVNTKKYTLNYNTSLRYTIDVAEGYSQSTPMFVLSGKGVVRYFVPVWLFGEQNTTITLLGDNCDISYNNTSGEYTYRHSGMTYTVSCVKGAAATGTKPAEPDKWTYTVTSGTNVETYIVKIGQNRQYSLTMNAEKDWEYLYAAVYRLVDTDKTTITTGKEKNPNFYQQSFKENSFDDTKITATIEKGNVAYGSANTITYTVKGGYSHNLPVITINGVPYYIPNMGDRNVFGETNESYGLVKESSNKWTYEYKVGEEVKATYYVTASTSDGQYVFNYYTTINEINVKILTLTIDVKNKENTVVSTDTKYVTAADGTTVVVTSKDRFQGDITYTYSVLQFYTDNIELSEAENKNTFAENKYLVVLSKRVLEGITGNSFKYKGQGDMKDASDNTFVIIVGKDATNGYKFMDPLATNTEITKQEGYYYNSYVWTDANSTQGTVIKDLTLIRKLGEALTHLPDENSTWESEGVTYKYYENKGVIDKTILAVEQNGVTTNKYKFTKQWGSSVSDNNGVSFNSSGLTSSEITGHIQLFATFCENAYRVKVGNLPTATGTYAKFGALFTTIKGGTSEEASSATSELMSFTKTKNLTLSYRVYAAYDQTEPVFNLVGLYGDIVLLMPKTIGYEDAAVTYQYQKQDGVAYTVTVIRDASNSNKYTYSVTANGKEVSFTLTITKSNINRVGASQISINYQIVFNNEFMGLNNADEVVVNIYPATHYEENDAVVKNINEVSNTNSAYNVSNIENNLTLNRYAINYYDMLLENKAVISKTAFGNDALFDGILALYNNINNTEEATVGSIELTKVTVSNKKYIICQNGGTTTYYTNVTAVGLNELIPGKNIDSTYENTNFDTTTFYITGKTGTKKIVHGENYVDQVKATSINAVRGYDSMNGTNYCWSDGKNEITTGSANLYDNMVVYPVYKEKGVTINFGSTVYLVGDNTLDFNQSPNQFAKVSGPSTSTSVKFTQERTFTVTVNEIYSKTEIDFSIAGDSNAIVKVSYVDNSTANGMQKVYTVKVSYVYSTESLLLKISAKNAKITTNNYQVILITPTKFEYATQAGVKEAGASIAAEILGETNSVTIVHGSKVSTTDAANSALLSKSNGISLEGWTFAGWYVPRNWSQYADIVNKYLNENKDSILDSTLFNNIKDGFGTITTNTSTTGYSRFATLGTNALVYTGETAITHDTILIAGFTRNQIQVKIYNTVQENDYFGFIDKASNIVNKDALTQGSDYLVKTIPYGTFIASPYDEMTNARIVPATEAFTRNTTENECFYLDNKGESTTFTPTSKIIKEDIEIYVGYTRKAFTINFEYKDSSGSTQRITIENVKYGTKISNIDNEELKTIIDPKTKKLINKSAPETGKHFVRWIYQTTIVDENYVVTRTATFSEVFDYNQFKISFDTTNIDSIVYNVGDTVGSANINEVQWVDNKLVLGYNKALVLALNPSTGYGKGGNYTAKLTFNGNKVDLDDTKLIIGNDGTITIMQGVLGNSEYVDGAEFTLVIEANINNYSVTIAGDNSIVCEGKTYNKDGNAWFYQDDNTNPVIKITAANADYNTDFIMTVSVFRSYNQKSVFVFKVYNGNNSEDYRIVTVDNSNLMTLSEDHNRFIGTINLGVATDDLTVELVSKIDDKETKIINNDYYIKFVVKIGNDKNGWKEELLTGTGYVGIMASEGNNHKIEKAIIPSAADLSVERTTDPSWCEMISNGWLMKKGGGVFTAEEWNAIDWTNMNTILESAYIGDATTSIEFTKDTTLYIVYMIKTIDVEVTPVSDDVKTKGSFSAPETANKRDPEAKTTVGFGEYTFTYTVGVKYSKNIPVIDIGGKKLVILPYIIYSGMNIGAQYQKEALYNDATAKFIVEKTESGYKYWQVGAESNQTTVNYNGGKYVFSGMDISVVPNDNQYTITLSNPQGAEDNKMTLSSNAATYEVNEYKVTYKLPDGTQKVETVKYEGSLVSVPEIKADFFHKITYTITYADGKTEKVSLKTLREIQFTSDATVTIKNEANVVVIILVAAAGVAVLAIVIISIVKAAGNAKYRSKASKENSEMFKKLAEQQQKQNKDNNGENGPKI